MGVAHGGTVRVAGLGSLGLGRWAWRIVGVAGLRSLGLGRSTQWEVEYLIRISVEALDRVPHVEDLGIELRVDGWREERRHRRLRVRDLKRPHLVHGARAEPLRVDVDRGEVGPLLLALPLVSSREYFSTSGPKKLSML